MNMKKPKLLFAALAAMVVCVSVVIGTSISNDDTNILISEQANDDNRVQNVIEDDDIYIIDDTYEEEVQFENKNVYSKEETIKKLNAPIISTENKVENKDKVVTNKNENSSNHTSSGGSSSKDENVQKPQIDDTKVKEDITGLVGDNQKLTKAVKMESKEGVKATVPAGVKIADGVKELELSILEKAKSDSNVDVEATERLDAYDIHIEGIAADNTVPVTIELGEVLTPGLNKGNLSLYHVEKNKTVEMTEVASTEDFAAHNQFAYDPENGALAVAMMSFSEVAVVTDTENKWEGEFDYTWYDASKKELTIANADQLAAFGAIVGGMNGQKQDSFAGKTVKLIGDVNLGDIEEKNNTDIIFYPIGYYNSTGSYEKTSGGSVTSSVSSFEGTFDGNGHTIANFYQNTWEMFGDYNDGYSGTPNHYKDAMGLFGYVLNGTVKNLTVDNFSSDGEFTPTGVIAAYADGNSTFANIAITNCNPRVYNTGNGGIIGVAGDTSAANDDHIALRNITVDNSNKISALWGSWDVACGGLVGMYRGNVDGSGKATGDTISFENCHVSAQIDVYNDVCANYQYYAYRYAGMMIGSVRHNKTENGHVYPDMTGISANGCTVHFGTWNDYYYCELVANTLASYTHDHQFSRLTEIKDIDGLNITYLDGTTGTVPASGRVNYVIVDYTKGHGTKNVTCYHFVDGKVWNHADAGKETVNGNEVLKEDNQHIYLEFNNLFTGYGWGVTTKAITNYKEDEIKILDREVADSVVKFNAKDGVSELENCKVINISDLFEAAAISDAKLSIKSENVQVTVSPAGEDSTAGGTYTANTTDWTKGTLTFNGVGKATVTITDYYFCKPTTITVNVTERQPVEKFESKFTGEFLYRVGNQNTVSVGSLFVAKDGVTISNSGVQVTIDKVDENSNVGGTFTSNTTYWTEGTIQFGGTGVVKVTIQDYNFCKPTEFYLEVVDAVNATSAISATSEIANNVVLLKDCSFSSLKVSDGYTLFGNGFTMKCESDSAALDMGYAFVTLENGTLDNVQIVCPNFDYAVLYKSNMTESGNRSETTDRTRYFNVKSGVMASGNSQILNSRISGGRAAVNVSGGNVVIDNSRIELGAVASVLVGAANNLTLRDVTLVQKPTASTHYSSKILMGFSVLVVCDSDGNSTPITIEGELIQNAWANETYKNYVPDAGSFVIDNVLKQADYLHDLDGDGTNESVNLGIAYMPESTTGTVNITTITDNRINKDDVPYDYVKVSNSQVYSYKNSNGTVDSLKNEAVYKPNKQSDIITVNYADITDGLATGKSFTSDGWVYELNVDLDKLSGYALDFSKLSMSVNGVALTDFKVNGTEKPASPVAVTAGGTTYTLVATVNEKEYVATYKVTGTETTKESPSLVSANYEAALLIGEAGSTLSKDTWHGAAPALEGIQIKYWSVAEKQYKTIELADYTPTTAGKQNGTNTTWTYSPDNGDFTLTITGGQVHSSNKVNAIPVVCNEKLYFVAANSNGLVNYGNDARTIPVTYEFKDNNNGDILKFNHTWSIECPDKAIAYDYSDFCNGTSKTFTIKSSNGNSCVTPDTLVTLYDGTRKRIDQITYEDQLLVWDFYTGQKISAPSSIVMNHGEYEYEIVTVEFSDGTKVNTINGHGFYDADEKQFVIISDNNVADYINHNFVKADGTKVKLVDYSIKTEYTESWSILTSVHYNCVMEGMWTLTPAEVENSPAYLMPFEIGKDMKFVEDKMYADIQKYGMYTYEEFQEYMTMEQFYAFNFPIFKVAVGKGYFTYEDILYLISVHFNVEIQDVTVPYVQAMAASIMSLANISVEPVSTEGSDLPEPSLDDGVEPIEYADVVENIDE